MYKEHFVSDKNESDKRQEIEVIDSGKFIKSLMKGTLILILFTGIFAGGGFALSYLESVMWQADAQAKPASVKQLGNFYNLYTTYQLVSSNDPLVLVETDKQDEDKQLVNSQIQTSETPEKTVFKEFVANLRSYDVAQKFWENSTYYKQKLNGFTEHDQQLLSQLIKSIHVTTNSQDPDSINISLTLDNPKQAAELLTEYITSVGKLTKDEVYESLVVRWKTLFVQVKSAADSGLQQDQHGNIVPASLWTSKLNVMKSVTRLDNQFSSYTLTQSPTIPLTIYSPSRLLWALMGGAIGLVLGLIMITLLAMRRRE